MSAIPVIVGPTASGKTRLAVDVARAAGGVVLSADARQLYRGFDVATGKEGAPGEIDLGALGRAPAWILDGVPQIGMDLAEPNERFTVARWSDWARRALGELDRQGRPVVVAGGSGLYVEALVRGFAFPGAAAPPVPFELRGLDPEREELKRRMRGRIERWFRSGALLDEVRRLRAAGVPDEAEPFTAIGYFEARAVLAGRLAPEEAERECLRRTWLYSRQQRSFLRNRLPEVHWGAHGAPTIVMNGQPTAAGRRP